MGLQELQQLRESGHPEQRGIELAIEDLIVQDAHDALEPLYKTRFPEFIEALTSKLQRGFESYGDKSFDGPLVDTISELQEEALDLAGWGFVLWIKLDRLRRAGR